MGNIQLSEFGNASAVLYDGKSFTPYILSTKSDGSNGIIYTIFSERTQSFSSHGTTPSPEHFPPIFLLSFIFLFFNFYFISFWLTRAGHVAFGWVIVISLAISLFLILLLVIGGVIAARIRRRREGYLPAPGTPPIGEETLERVPPAQLFGELEGRRRAAAGYL